MTRRTVLWSPIALGARKAWNFVADAFGQTTNGGSQTALTKGDHNGLVLENANHRLEFDRRSGRLLSLRAKPAPGQEFAVDSDTLPAFVIQYLTGSREFLQLSSMDAKRTEVQLSGQSLHAQFSGLGGLDLAATVTVRMDSSAASSRWSIAVQNHADLAITDVQFPFVTVRYQLEGAAGSESLLQPLTTGRFVQAPVPTDLEPDSPHAWQFRPDNFDTHHYPGLTFAQFLAYYNDRAGIYIACEDASGSIKLIKPVHSRAGGIRLGFSHVGDWPSGGERDLGYDVVVRAFQGDWYDAAGIYRDWSLKQQWAMRPLHQRNDVPDWLLDSPPHIIIRMQGQVDHGPAEPNTEFLPYPKLAPLLENISKQLGAPLAAIVMSWERPGPWIYPDCFPPVGGDESLREFAELARKRGWHVGSYCNGTRWVTQHFWSGYDGNAYFQEQHGEKTVCRTHDLQLWSENWGGAWRPSYAGCLGVARTREMAEALVRRLTDDGLDWIQFLDQNAACSTFPCFAADHSHPVGPGKWMNAAMQSMLDGFRQIAGDQTRKSSGVRKIVFSVESPPNEFFMPNFQVCDQRVAPPGHPDHGSLFFPLYSFLYHEFLLIQGGFGVAPAPYHLEIRSAYNLVMGEIPGALLTGDGTLLNRGDTDAWWSLWNSSAGSQENCVAMLRRAVALRRARAKRYLVFGRMQRPAHTDGIHTMRWENNRHVYNIPSVFHSAWHGPQGQFAIVLANWTTAGQQVDVLDPRLGARVSETTSADQLITRQAAILNQRTRVIIPPLSCVLLENEASS